MTTFFWRIDFLPVLQTPEPNTVVSSVYTVVGVDGDVTAEVIGSVNLPPPDPSDFTPYDQITQSQAVAWTKSALGPEMVAALESQVQWTLDKNKVPQPTTPPLPWG